MEFMILDQDSKVDLTGWKLDALQKFEAKMTDKEKMFPCIPATQGFSLNHLRYGFCDDPRKVSSAQTLATLLKFYSKSSRKFGDYTSLIVFFRTPKDLILSGSVEYFEKLFWRQLNIVSNLDECNWPDSIPVEPNEHLWEFCFHGERYFMFCATPLHQNRSSRHFPYMMLAITPRWVLDTFNQHVKHSDKVKKQIRKRLVAYDTLPAHPHLNNYGNIENHEWKQYFLHDDQSAISKCPFHGNKISNEEVKESEV